MSTHDTMLQQTKQLFEQTYGSHGEIFCFHSPGRVNLIGEHTDYNGGYVFPCALSLGTYGAARKRDDNTLNFASANFALKVSCSLDDLKYDLAHEWANFLTGAIQEFKTRGYNLSGMDILISGNLPNASGLSSSASIELLACVLVNDLFGCNVDMIDMVKWSQHAENTFVGVNCGIMDQFAVGMGKKDQAMLLDCATLKYEYVPVELKGCKLIIVNTNKRRELVDSKYNERRGECDKAVEYLNQKLNISLLADLTPEQFEENKHLIADPVVLKRAEHVVYEIKRTLEAVNRLKQGEIREFGELMIQSHNSLRDLYEVTGIELDTLVSEALKIEGVIGSRMTGAGFGGCTVSIVEDDAIERFTQTVKEAYTKTIGYEPSFYVAEIGDGTKRYL